MRLDGGWGESGDDGGDGWSSGGMGSGVWLG